MTPNEFRRIRRGVLDLSQEELAKAMGVTGRTITAIERADKEVSKIYALALKSLAANATQPAE